MNKRKKLLNIGIIGCGLIGKKRSLCLGKKGKLVAVCDITQKRIDEVKKKNNKIKEFKNWKNIFSVNNLDILIISTPHNMLAKIIEFAIKKNKINLFVEKPGVKNFIEIKRILKIYNHAKTKIKVKFGFNHRYHESVVLAKQLIKNNQVGKLMYLRGVYGHGGNKDYKKEWRGRKEYSGGGELLDQGIHLIDLSRFFLGEFSSIKSDLNTFFRNTKVEDNAFLILKSKKKLAFLHASWTEWKNRLLIEIFGKKGKIEIYGKGGSYGIETLTLYKMIKNKEKPLKKIWVFKDNLKSWKNELEEFYKEIKGKKNSSKKNLKNVYENFKIINQIYKKNDHS